MVANVSTEYNGISPLKTIFILGLIAVIGLVFLLPVIKIPSRHAFNSHAADYIEVNQCMENGGKIQTWFNKTTNRVAQLCQVNEKRFGIEITERNGNVIDQITAYIKNKMTTLRQVENYLLNTGYECVLGCQ